MWSWWKSWIYSKKEKGTKKIGTLKTKQDSPDGLILDANNWSCAYDAIFTILCDIWMNNPNKWSKIFSYISKPLVLGLKDVVKGKSTWEKKRNKIRHMLYKMQRCFPKVLMELLSQILQENS